jgi:intergrase/recombinase
MSSKNGNGNVSFVNIFVMFIMTVILLTYLHNHTSEIEFVKSNVDGRVYLVRSLPDKQQAADTLARLNQKLAKLVQHVMAKYGKKNPDAARLYRNFDPDNVSEGGVEHGYTSFSVNKGEKIVMCVRQKDRELRFVDENLLTYVAVHELAHLMTHDVGHSNKFWQNFKFLLLESVEIGVYTRVDYARYPKDYCGIKITSSII